MMRWLGSAAVRMMVAVVALLLGLMAPIHASGPTRSCADDVALPAFVDDLTPPTQTFLAAYHANGPPDGVLILVPLDTAMEVQAGPLRRFFVGQMCIRGWSAGGTPGLLRVQPSMPRERGRPRPASWRGTKPINVNDEV